MGANTWTQIKIHCFKRRMLIYFPSSQAVRPVAFCEGDKEDLCDRVILPWLSICSCLRQDQPSWLNLGVSLVFSRAQPCQTCHAPASAQQRLQFPIPWVRNHAHPNDQSMASPEIPGWSQAVKKWNHRARENKRPAAYSGSKPIPAAPGREQANTRVPFPALHGEHSAWQQQRARSWTLPERYQIEQAFTRLLYLCNKLSEELVSLSSAADFAPQYGDSYCNIFYSPSPSPAHPVP